MGKTKRKEKIFNDSLFDEREVIFEDNPPTNHKRKKAKAPRRPPLEEYDEEENYGSFEKIGKRR
tara:strand:- start:1820 stop:2011 length:192 start_codon:yes stop_codon:yes gene_type:complete